MTETTDFAENLPDTLASAVTYYAQGEFTAVFARRSSEEDVEGRKLAEAYLVDHPDDARGLYLRAYGCIGRADLEQLASDLERALDSGRLPAKQRALAVDMLEAVEWVEKASALVDLPEAGDPPLTQVDMDRMKLALASHDFVNRVARKMFSDFQHMAGERIDRPTGTDGLTDHQREVAETPEIRHGDEAEGPLYKGRPFSYWKAQLKSKEDPMKAALSLHFRGPDAIPILTTALQDEDAHIRAAAAYALDDMRSYFILADAEPEVKNAIVALAEAFRDEDEKVRSSARFALTNIRLDAKAAIPTLARILNDQSEAKEVRCSAARTLGGMGAEAIPFLASVLKTADDGIRLEVAEAVAHAYWTSEHKEGVAAKGQNIEVAVLVLAGILEHDENGARRGLAALALHGMRSAAEAKCSRINNLNNYFAGVIV